MPKTRSKRKSRSPEKPYSRKPKPFIHPCRTSYVKSYQDGNEFPVYNCILEGMNIDIHPLWERIRSSLEQVKKDLPVFLLPIITTTDPFPILFISNFFKLRLDIINIIP